MKREKAYLRAKSAVDAVARTLDYDARIKGHGIPLNEIHSIMQMVVDSLYEEFYKTNKDKPDWHKHPDLYENI